MLNSHTPCLGMIQYGSPHCGQFANAFTKDKAESLGVERHFNSNCFSLASL